jgi:hypothetical protein
VERASVPPAVNAEVSAADDALLAEVGELEARLEFLRSETALPSADRSEGPPRVCANVVSATLTDPTSRKTSLLILDHESALSPSRHRGRQSEECARKQPGIR